MNSYVHDIREHIVRTIHLTLIEEGSLIRLEHAYLHREAPLPGELADVCKIVRATSRKERRVVSEMLREFFEITPLGWRCERLDQIIDEHRKSEARFAVLRAGQAWRQFRDEVLARDKYRCVYCGAVDVPLQLDHIIPRSRGGSDTPDNLAAACRSCNSSKGAKLLSEWRRHVEG